MAEEPEDTGPVDVHALTETEVETITDADWRTQAAGSRFTTVAAYKLSAAHEGGWRSDECGSVQTGRWWGLFREIAGTGTYGAILTEDSQGFVTAVRYDDAEQLESMWAECKALAYGPDDDDADGDG